MVEPPPVYSSLTAIDKIQIRGEETKKNKRGLFLSPFTFCIEPKKFATIHAYVSLAFCTVGVVYATLVNKSPVGPIILDCCLPTIPFLISANFGLMNNRPNFILVTSIYMIASFVLIFVPSAIWICWNIPFIIEGGANRDWAILGIALVIPFTPMLLYTSHAARVYLRIYFDIRDERKERNAEIKLPLV